jgi:HSP20 family molecular chaperone IbpA
MNDFFDLFFDDAFDSMNPIGFAKPVTFKFESGNTHDMNPAYWTELKHKEKEDGTVCYRAIVRSVGVNSENVKVKVNKNSINVKGDTTTKGIHYWFDIDLPVSEEILADAENVSYEVKDGMTYVYLYVKKPAKKDIKVEYLK